MPTSVCFPSYHCTLFYRDASWLIPPLLTINYRGATGRQWLCGTSTSSITLYFHVNLFCLYVHIIYAFCWINISYRIVSYRIVSYRIVSYRIVSYRIVSYRIVSYRIVSYRIVSYRIVSYRIVSYRIVSYRIVSYRIVSYIIDGHYSI